MATCSRCNGSGIHIAHPHQQTGSRCFKCGGSGQAGSRGQRSANPDAIVTCYDCGSLARRKDLRTISGRRLCEACVAASGVIVPGGGGR